MEPKFELVDKKAGCFFLCNKCNKLVFTSSQTKALFSLNSYSFAILDLEKAENQLYKRFKEFDKKKVKLSEQEPLRGWWLKSFKCGKEECTNVIWQYVVSSDIEGLLDQVVAQIRPADSGTGVSMLESTDMLRQRKERTIRLVVESTYQLMGSARLLNLGLQKLNQQMDVLDSFSTHR